MTQAQLSVELISHSVDIDPSGVARIERGERSPRFNEAVAIAEVLGIHLVAPGDAGALRGMLLQAGDAERQVLEEVTRLNLQLAQIDERLAEARTSEALARETAAELRSRKAQIMSRLSDLGHAPWETRFNSQRNEADQ